MINGVSGAVESLALIKTSGVKEFDGAAMLAMLSAFPLPAPHDIWSSDGRVYVAWSFHRRKEEACSTDLAWPFKIVTDPIERHGR